MTADDILDGLPDAAALSDADGRLVYRNLPWRELSRRLGIAEDCHGLAECFAEAERLRAEAEGRPEILRLTDGSIVEHRVTVTRLPLAGGKPEGHYTLHLLRDIGDSWHLAEERHFIERLYRTLSHCNQTLVRARDAKNLAQGICDGLVRHGGYRYGDVSVWLAVEGNGFERLAWAADEAVIAKGAALLERLQETGRRFLADHLPRLFARTEAERRKPASIPAEAFHADFASPLAIECYPLLDGERPLGALIVASTPGEVSRVREFGLLEELASDLAFGLETLRLREHNARLEAERLAQLQRERDQLLATVEAIGSMIELRDPYTAGHQRRVRKLALKLGELLGLSAERLEGLGFAAGIHDIGKIQVPAEILTKPARLSATEFELIKAHCENGANVLAPIAFPWPVAEIVRQHHERFDGSGYPQGLRGDETLFEARILAVADVIEAMATHRPYRPAHPLLDVLQHITQNRGTLYDPTVVDACLKLFVEQRFALEQTPRSQ